ncbi:hypothetical protein T06_7919 [Trichinella sp. T6]|nr:hypothetical protein T06_7919 [Trichinella sp. T6]
MISAIDNIIVNVCSKKHSCEVLSADHKHNVRVSTTPANMFPPSLPLKYQKFKFFRFSISDKRTLIIYGSVSPTITANQYKQRSGFSNLPLKINACAHALRGTVDSVEQRQDVAEINALFLQMNGTKASFSDDAVEIQDWWRRDTPERRSKQPQRLFQIKFLDFSDQNSDLKVALHCRHFMALKYIPSKMVSGYQRNIRRWYCRKA